jgi:putative protease
MAPVIALKPDALIMSDPGLIDMVRETWPEQAVHLSVQANTVNWAAVRFWKKLGSPASSCRANCRSTKSPKSASVPGHRTRSLRPWRAVHRLFRPCLLSGYFNHRDPNQGTCTNSCRWDYKVTPRPAAGAIHGPRTEILLEEKQRPAS